MKIYLLLITYLLNIFTYCATPTIPPSITISTTHHNELSQDISFTFLISKKDFLYKDFITFTVAHPLVHISSWKANTIAVPYYDPVFKTTKEIFKKNTTITITVTTEHLITDPLHLYCSYYQHSEKKIKQFMLPFFFTDQHTSSSSINLLHTHLDTHGAHEKIKLTTNTSLHGYINHMFNTLHTYYRSLSIPLSTHIVCVLALLFCAILLSYLLHKRLFSNQHVHDNAVISTLTLYFILLFYILYHGFYTITPCIMTPLTTIAFICIGIFYLKKSAHISWRYMRTFCNICGSFCISISIPLLCKSLQLIGSRYFFY